MDASERRIGLSIKSARRQDELADAQGFANASQAGATLGDVMGKKFGTLGDDRPTSTSRRR